MSSLKFDPAAVINSRPWYERALGAVAPSWELRRMQARVQRHLFEYQAAQSDRLFAPKTSGVPAESSRTAWDRVVMMWEARDLVENFGPAKVILSKYAENIAPTEYSPATGDREYDAMVADYFHGWCRQCDFEGRHGFRKLIELAAMTQPVDGDCGFVLRKMADGNLRVQFVPGDRIGSPHEISLQEGYFSGIIVDQYGRPLSYRIFRVDRNGTYGSPEDIARDNFVHYADQFRGDQYRGVTDVHAVLRTARMIKDILEAEQVGVKFASQQAALVFNETGTPQPRNIISSPSNATLPNGEVKQQEASEFGIIRYLTRGDKVEVMPSRPGSSFQGFTDLLMDHFGLGIGVATGVLFGTKDYKGPSVRAEFAQADRTFARKRANLATKVLDPIRDAVLLAAIGRGEIPLPPKQAGETAVVAMRRALRGAWRFPAKLTIDVGRESEANINENQIGAKSLQELAAEQDADAFARLEQNAQVAAEVARLAEKYKVTESAIRLIGKSLPNTPAAAAAVGQRTGEDASAATSAAYKPKDGTQPEPSSAGPDTEDDGEEDTGDPQEMRRRRVREALERGRNRRARPLGLLLERSQRLAAFRAKVGEQAADGSSIKVALTRLGYVEPPPPPAPPAPPAPVVVPLEVARETLREKVSIDDRITELCASLKSRREKLAAK